MTRDDLAVLRLVSAPRARVLASAALAATTVAFGAGLMATAGYLISRAAEHPPILSLTIAIVAVRFFGIARPLARYLERLASHDLALRALGRARVHAWQRLEPLAPAQLRGFRQGDLLSRAVADVESLQSLHLRGLGPALAAVFAGAATVGVAAAVLPAAAVVLAAGLLAGGLAVPPLAAAATRRAERRQAAARGRLAAELVAVLDTRVRAADRALVGLARRDACAAGHGDGLWRAVAGATVGGVLAVAAGASAAGALDPVLIAMLALLALASMEAVAPLPAAARELSATLAAGRRLLELTRRPAAVVDPRAPAPPPAWPFAVALTDVTARYAPGDAPALAGVSLRIEPGARVALVGPSGAGKTTVANLLLRFLDPEAGRVAFGDRDVRGLRQEDVRRAVAVAGQDAHLFAASIRENVCLARPDVADAEVEAALARARILDWVRRLPDGWDTRVGENGRELSGGQRQRIVLARALLAGAPLLVLDEPTAHLDPQTAHELVRDVLAAADGRSVLLITHRSEGLEMVDEVVALVAA